MRTASWQPHSVGHHAGPDSNEHSDGPNVLFDEPWELIADSRAPLLVPASVALVSAISWLQFGYDVRLRDAQGNLVLRVDKGKVESVAPHVQPVFDLMRQAFKSVVDPYVTTAQDLARKVVELERALEQEGTGQTGRESSGEEAPRDDKGAQGENQPVA